MGRMTTFNGRRNIDHDDFLENRILSAAEIAAYCILEVCVNPHYDRTLPLTTGTYRIYCPSLKDPGFCVLGLSSHGQLLPQEKGSEGLEDAIFSFQLSSETVNGYYNVYVNGQPLVPVDAGLARIPDIPAFQWLFDRDFGSESYSISSAEEDPNNPDILVKSRWSILSNSNHQSYLALRKGSIRSATNMYIQPTDIFLAEGDYVIYYADKNRQLRALGLDDDDQRLVVLPLDAHPSQFCWFKFTLQGENKFGTLMTIHANGEPIVSDTREMTIKCQPDTELCMWVVLLKDKNIISIYSDSGDDEFHCELERLSWFTGPASDGPFPLGLSNLHQLPRPNLWYIRRV